MPQLFSLDTIAKKKVEKKGKLLNIIHTPGFFFFLVENFSRCNYTHLLLCGSATAAFGLKSSH